MRLQILFPLVVTVVTQALHGQQPDTPAGFRLDPDTGITLPQGFDADLVLAVPKE